MPLLFFDVPILWSPSTPPFRFKVDGFFCCLKFKLFKIMMLETLFFNDGDKMAAASKRERHLS
ncbi:hypothetical protein BWI85_00060 [Escherichia coli]|nr:hypothetical protein BWI85_00060 [Escherichia coli]